MKTVSFIILTHNRLDEMVECFESLEYTLKRPDVVEWLVLDNNSTDETAKYVKSFSKGRRKVRAFFYEKNLGVALGRKILMGHAKGDYLLFLDSDVVVKRRDFLDKLKKRMDMPAVGVTGCAGLNFERDTLIFRRVDESFEGFVESIMGYCMLFRRDAISQGCEIDDYFSPFWAEETDLCYQIREKTGLRAYKINNKKSGIIHNNTSVWDDTDSSRKDLYLILKHGLVKDKRIYWFYVLHKFLECRWLFKKFEKKVLRSIYHNAYRLIVDE